MPPTYAADDQAPRRAPQPVVPARPARGRTAAARAAGGGLLVRLALHPARAAGPPGAVLRRRGRRLSALRRGLSRGAGPLRRQARREALGRRAREPDAIARREDRGRRGLLSGR